MQRCLGCRAWIWGPQFRCGGCGTWDPEWVEVAPRGQVFSWIRTWHAATPEAATLVPYVSVLVELPAAGTVRVLGTWAGDGDPVMGQPVEVDWDVTPDGRGMAWRPGGPG